MPIARVVGFEIRPNRDGQRDRLVLQGEITDGDDIQSVEVMCGSGEDWNPPDGSNPNQPSPRVLVLEAAGAAYQLAIACDDGVAPSCLPGERKMYSVGGGSVLALVFCRADGHVELNGGGDTAVRFSELKSKLDALEIALQAHTHPGVTAGMASTGAPVPGTFDCDITAAESPTVEIP